MQYRARDEERKRKLNKQKGTASQIQYRKCKIPSMSERYRKLEELPSMTEQTYKKQKMKRERYVL